MVPDFLKARQSVVLSKLPDELASGCFYCMLPSQPVSANAAAPVA